jgi:hypothetical protein
MGHNLIAKHTVFIYNGKDEGALAEEFRRCPYYIYIRNIMTKEQYR